MEKLNPELKKKWIDALRSGEYKQGRCYLHNKSNDTYCCLGVLGSLTGSTNPVDVYYTRLSLSKQMMLMNANDTLAKTFLEIADIIEKDEEI